MLSRLLAKNKSRRLGVIRRDPLRLITLGLETKTMRWRFSAWGRAGGSHADFTAHCGNFFSHFLHRKAC